MADNVELDDEQLLRKLLETIARGKGDSSSSSEGIQENVAQLLAAALNQVSQETGSGDILTSNEVEINNVDNTVEVPSSSSSAPTGGTATAERQKNLGIKFSPEIRRTIVNYRKGGKRYRDIAKELGASVSGVQKVWERFLSTGTIGDRKPSLPVGRPRKFGKTGDMEPSLPSTEEREGEEFIETSATGECPLQAVLITDDNNIEEPMDVPGATVEVVATTTNSNQPAAVTEKKNTKRKITTPTYREELLLKLVRDCPLARMREDSAQTTNQHVLNLLSSIHQPLYMEYVLGHPFGRVPSPRPFQRNEEESKVILSDTADPIGKEVLAVLGYTTKVYFNACCNPSPLFDDTMVLRCLPLSIGPGYIGDTIQELVQLLLKLCQDPLDAIKLLPDEASGVQVHAVSPVTGGVATRQFIPPTKLSSYWSDVYYYGNLFKCCENFLSATPPSSPCLLCHSFESFAENLEIIDSEVTPSTLSNQDDQFVPLAASETVTVVTEDHPSPDGIRYVAYSRPQNTTEEATPTIVRRSSRKRTGATPSGTSTSTSGEEENRTKRICS